jgi:hypothetical protein
MYVSIYQDEPGEEPRMVIQCVTYELGSFLVELFNERNDYYKWRIVT